MKPLSFQANLVCKNAAGEKKAIVLAQVEMGVKAVVVLTCKAPEPLKVVGVEIVTEKPECFWINDLRLGINSQFSFDQKEGVAANEMEFQNFAKWDAINTGQMVTMRVTRTR